MILLFTLITVAIVCFGYSKYLDVGHYESPHSPIGQSEVALAYFVMTVALIVITWAIYFAIIRNFVMTVILVGVIVVPIVLVFGQIIIHESGQYLKYYRQNKEITQPRREEEYQKSLPWLNTVENKEYSSEKLGVSFQYASPTKDGGIVEIEEVGDTITLHLEKIKKGGVALKVFTKDKDSTLLEYVREKYSKTNPFCQFDDATLEYSSDSTLHSNYSAVYMASNRSEASEEASGAKDCPIFGIEDSVDTLFLYTFIMNNESPGKYIVLAPPRDNYPQPGLDRRILSHKQKNANDINPRFWDETLILK